MSARIFLCTLIALLTVDDLWSQRKGPIVSDARMTLLRGTEGIITRQDTALSRQQRIGIDATDTCRAYYQWDLPDLLIPDGVTLDSARLVIRFSQFSSSAPFNMSRIDSNLRTENNYELFILPTLQTTPTTLHSFQNNRYDRTFRQNDSSSSWFLSWIESRLPADRFSLCLWSLLDDRGLYYIVADSVRLTLWVRPLDVTVDAYFEDNRRVWLGWVQRWTNTMWEQHDVTYNSLQFPWFVLDSLILRADTNLLINPYTGPRREKYNNWNGLPDVRELYSDVVEIHALCVEGVENKAAHPYLGVHFQTKTKNPRRIRQWQSITKAVHVQEVEAENR